LKFSSYQAKDVVATNVVFPVVVAAVVTVVTVVFMLEKRTYRIIFNFLNFQTLRLQFITL
jgi:hypothetical protein